MKDYKEGLTLKRSGMAFVEAVKCMEEGYWICRPCDGIPIHADNECNGLIDDADGECQEFILEDFTATDWEAWA